MPPQQKYLFDVPPAGKIAEAARSIILAVKRDVDAIVSSLRAMASDLGIAA